MNQGNQLFPVFLRMDKLHLLIIGGGNVGFEKIGFLFRHCTNATITLIAPEIDQRIISLQQEYSQQITLIKKEFESVDLDTVDLVIAATNNKLTNKFIWEQAKQKEVLINVADTPDLCDFYLSSIVKKGDLKIAISSNGKSPTLTKRIKELLNEVLPEEIDELIQNLAEIRNQLKGDFESKVDALNLITKDFTK
jgi:siroheme synthase-like protein